MLILLGFAAFLCIVAFVILFFTLMINLGMCKMDKNPDACDMVNNYGETYKWFIGTGVITLMVLTPFIWDFVDKLKRNRKSKALE